MDGFYFTVYQKAVLWCQFLIKFYSISQKVFHSSGFFMVDSDIWNQFSIQNILILYFEFCDLKKECRIILIHNTQISYKSPKFLHFANTHKRPRHFSGNNPDTVCYIEQTQCGMLFHLDDMMSNHVQDAHYLIQHTQCNIYAILRHVVLYLGYAAVPSLLRKCLNSVWCNGSNRANACPLFLTSLFLFTSGLVT